MSRTAFGAELSLDERERLRPDSPVDVLRYPQCWAAVRGILLRRAREAAGPDGTPARPTSDQIEAAVLKAIAHTRATYADILSLPLEQRIVWCTRWLPHAAEAATAAFGEDVALGWLQRLGAGQKPETHEILGYVRTRPEDPALYAVVRRRAAPE